MSTRGSLKLFCFFLRECFLLLFNRFGAHLHRILVTRKWHTRTRASLLQIQPQNHESVSKKKEEEEEEEERAHLALAAAERAARAAAVGAGAARALALAVGAAVRLVGAATCVGLRAAAFALRRVAARLVRAAHSSKRFFFFDFCRKAKNDFFVR